MKVLPIRRRLLPTLLCSILLSAACFFAIQGTGDYEYEFEAGKPDTALTPEIPKPLLLNTPQDSLPPDTTPPPENLDDDFDLLDVDDDY